MNIANKQDEYFCANIKNMIYLSQKRNYPQFSMFLDDRQTALANAVLKKEVCNRHCYYGGYDGAERCMLSVWSDDFSERIREIFPISGIKISYSGFHKITHSDVLGSLMGLNIKREAVGDIIIGDGFSFVFVAEGVKDFVLSNLFKIGKANVTLCENDFDVVKPEQKYEEIEGTVASMRLDCVVSLAIRKGRKIAAELIGSGKVSINHEEILSVSKLVAPDDRIAIRSFGKYVVTDEMKSTKKDRIYIKILKLL